MGVDILSVWETVLPDLQCQGHAYVKTYIVVFVQFYSSLLYYYISLSRVFQLKSSRPFETGHMLGPENLMELKLCKQFTSKHYLGLSMAIFRITTALLKIKMFLIERILFSAFERR